MSPISDPGYTPAEPEDELWMQRALEQAHAAAAAGEVPVGAVVVQSGRLIAEAGNQTRTTNDPTGHAEIIALRRAAERLGSWWLPDATLYVSLEPCAMCAGASVLARIQRIVFAAYDPKSGMCGSLDNIVQDPRLNHQVRTTAGILQDEAARILHSFFRSRRR